MTWHKPANAMPMAMETFPKPGTKWRPLHKRPHQNNQPITIRRFIALAKEKYHESI